MSIEPEDLDSSEIPCICLGGTQMRMGNMNGPGNRADVLTGEMDESRGQVDGTTGEMDTSNVSNRAETAGISSGEGVGMYLEAGGMKCIIDATDGIKSHTDMSSRHMDMPNVQIDAKIPRNVPDTVSIPCMKAKPPDLPFRTTKWIPDEPYGCRDHVDASNAHMDPYSIGNSMETTAMKCRTSECVKRT